MYGSHSASRHQSKTSQTDPEGPESPGIACLLINNFILSQLYIIYLSKEINETRARSCALRAAVRCPPRHPGRALFTVRPLCTCCPPRRPACAVRSLRALSAACVRALAVRCPPCAWWACPPHAREPVHAPSKVRNCACAAHRVALAVCCPPRACAPWPRPVRCAARRAREPMCAHTRLAVRCPPHARALSAVRTRACAAHCVALAVRCPPRACALAVR
jgi:hypothetical protein